MDDIGRVEVIEGDRSAGLMPKKAGTSVPNR